MDKWNETTGLKWELERQLALMNSQFNRRVLIDLFVWNDDQNSSRHVIYIDQPTLGMPSRDYYFSGGRDRKVGGASLQHRTPVAPTPWAGLLITHPASLPAAGVVSNCAVSPALRWGWADITHYLPPSPETFPQHAGQARGQSLLSSSSMRQNCHARPRNAEPPTPAPTASAPTLCQPLQAATQFKPPAAPGVGPPARGSGTGHVSEKLPLSTLCTQELTGQGGLTSIGAAPCPTPTPPPQRPRGPWWPSPPSPALRPLAQVREAYLQLMVSVATMLREDENLPRDSRRVQEDMAQVLQLETQLAKATAPQEERHDVIALYHRMGLKELQSQFGLKGFNWTLFIQTVLSSVNVKLLPDEEVVVYGVPYLQNLESILDTYSARTIQNYLAWRLVLDRIGSLSQRFKDTRVNYRRALFGTMVEEVRWRECVGYVNSNMESAVGSLYVREAFPRDSKSMVRELVGKVRAVFVETLDELSWMDEESKEKAREKAMSIQEQIGHPDYILEERNRRLDEEYSNLNFSEDLYFENGLQNLKVGAQRGLRKLREKADPNLWIIGAAVVNAFYSPNRNQIVFPAGILQPPLFSEEQPQALNFGGIGTVIGHEITHGFDNSGRNFDKNGNMMDWWSNFSSQHFWEQSECMIYQYGNYSWDLAEGQNVNGFNTLGENIADNGGVRQAYQAYLKWMAEGGKDQQLPGLALTHEQLFFINYAQVWCGSYRPEFAIQSIKTDVHSPLKYRVLGSLQNLAAFADTFHCTQGTPMHPKERCRVW
uniref:Membrane metalloendopeptidase like 1 n=1 Tax=Callithrix jacchus TaxID=9483 RepID=A0A8I4A4G7_CALJA